MLIKDAVIDAIKTGKITVLFRRWSKPGVKAGGTQMTQGGVIAIDSVEVVSEAKITDLDALNAGFASKADLIEHLAYRGDPIYRIGVRFAGEDPRIALRQNDDLTDAEIADLVKKLRSMDTRSQRGPWTQSYLQIIHDMPATYSGVLARELGLTIPQFKPWVRKLKALGLTESLERGYRLSPRGIKALEAMREQSRR